MNQKIISNIPLLLAGMLLLATSCEKDNRAEPRSVLKGRIVHDGQRSGCTFQWCAAGIVAAWLSVVYQNPGVREPGRNILGIPFRRKLQAGAAAVATAPGWTIPIRLMWSCGDPGNWMYRCTPYFDFQKRYVFQRRGESECYIQPRTGKYVPHAGKSQFVCRHHHHRGSEQQCRKCAGSRGQHHRLVQTRHAHGNPSRRTGRPRLCVRADWCEDVGCG